MHTTLTRHAARLLSAAALMALATACPAPPPPDTSPPASAALAVGTVAETSIQVSWTAVGDDGSTGTATSYDLRSSSGAACPISQGNFDRATAIPGLGAPQAAGTAESFTATGLTGDTAYCFMLKVTDDAGNSSFSGAVVASTVDTVAPAKAVLAASNTSDTFVIVTWSAVGDNGTTGTATSQELRYASGASCPLTAANFGSASAATGVPAPAAAGTSQSVTVNGLTPSANYCFALRVVDEVGNSNLSSSLAVTTSDTVGPAAAALQTGAATGTSIALSWTAVGDDGSTGTATSYELRYASGAAACPLTSANFSSGTQLTGLPTPSAAGTSETYTASGLTPDTAYCFTLKVTDDVGNSSFSNSASGATADVTAPAAAAISTTSVIGTSVVLGWLAVGDDGSAGTATAYDLRYASGSSCPLTPATFNGATAVTGLPTPGPAGTPESALVSFLTSDTDYCFMLKVTDDGGNNSFSNSLAQRTQDVTPPASASLSAGSVGGASIQVNWTAVGDDGSTGTATAHDLRYRSGASCPINAANFGASTQVPGLSPPRASGSSESVIVSGLTSDTTYCFMLQVSDDASNTSLSNMLTQATSDVTAPASVSLNAAVFDTSFQLDWTAVGDDGNTGTASSQELRYLSGAACPINQGNFATGTLASGLGAPAAAGTPETLTVSGLQRQTSYCFALKVSDEAGNASVSNTFSGTTPDTAAPDVAVLSTSGAGARSIHVTWTAVGDDGATGTATAYDLRYLSGAACPVTSGNFNTATAVTTGAPQAAGSAEDYTVNGLTPGTSYCFALKVTDDASNSSLSASASGSTLADTTPPGPVADLTVGTTTATSIQLTWTAVADDGTTAATGPAASYDLRYLLGATCSASDFGTATPVAGIPAPGSPGTPQLVNVTGLATGVSYCFLLQVTDAASNSSFSNSASGSTVDSSPPGPVTDLVALGPDATGAVSLSWTAVGAHGSTGTASSYALRYQTGDCATFDFATATPVAGLAPPAPSGTAEAFTVSGLSIFSKYCFGLQVSNSVPTSSLSNAALAFAGTSAQIAAIRQLIHDGASTPIPLNAAVQGAIVTYTKATVNGRPPGIPDGPGFFIQNDATGPALFFALDPAAVLPGMAASDVLDLSITEGAWTTCQVPPCTADTGMYVITQATATPQSTGAALPAVQDLTNVTLPLPIVTGPWEYEHERVRATGTIGAISTAGAGFSRATFSTPGTSSTNQEFRFTDAVMVNKGLIAGCGVTVNGSPMWRFGGFAQFAAWADADVTPSGCPAIAIDTTTPLDGATGVPATTDVAVDFNQPMTQASMSGQATAGRCSGNLQLSADSFATCVPFSTSAASLSLDNNVATLTPAAPLKGTGAYKIRVGAAAASGNGNTLGAAFTQPTGFTIAGGTCASVAPVVISAFYGAGGNAGAILDHDYVELHNRGTSPVSLNGWSLQYNSASGVNAWNVSALPTTASIAPGGYFLVQHSGGANGVPLPTPDATGTLSMSATTGRIALLTTTTALPAGTSCPPAGVVVDFVAYGSPVLCAEGTSMAALTTTTGAIRGGTGSTSCTDTDSNSADFGTGAPAPRNSSVTPNTCACP